MNSTRISELRTTMPASAIMPIIAVAVNMTGSGEPATVRSPNWFISQKPGMIPMMVSGIDDMMMSDRAVDAVCSFSTKKIATRANAKASPMSRNTRTVIRHSPSPVHSTSMPCGTDQPSPEPGARKLRPRHPEGSPAGCPRSASTSAITSAGVRPESSAVT